MKDRLIFLIAVALLISGCAASSQTTSGLDTKPGATRPPDSPTVPRPVPETPLASEPSQPPAADTKPGTPITGESMPPAVEDITTPTAAETARADLAHRLNADIALVEVVDVVMRPPERETMSCLADGLVPEELWGRAEEVKWITLSVKGNVYHYVALGDLVVYCDG
jgi:hypothetical protein